VPLYVATKWHLSRGLHSLYHQQADTQAGQRWLGNEPRCTPYWPHSVIWDLLYSLPEAAIDAWRYGFYLKF
nr:very-long-chain 3-oxoacyl-CoA reductase 1-like [Tanacetum cinerariifolium]